MLHLCKCMPQCCCKILNIELALSVAMLVGGKITVTIRSLQGLLSVSYGSLTTMILADLSGKAAFASSAEGQQMSRPQIWAILGTVLGLPPFSGQFFRYSGQYLGQYFHPLYGLFSAFPTRPSRSQCYRASRISHAHPPSRFA